MSIYALYTHFCCTIIIEGGNNGLNEQGEVMNHAFKVTMRNGILYISVRKKCANRHMPKIGNVMTIVMS